MSRDTARRLRGIAYLNGILTVIAVLLMLNLATLGLLSPRAVQATNVVPVQIEGVRGNIPVAMREPVSVYPHSVFVNPCK